MQKISWSNTNEEISQVSTKLPKYVGCYRPRNIRRAIAPARHNAPKINSRRVIYSAPQL